MIVTINIGSSSARLGLHTAAGKRLCLEHSDSVRQQADMAAALHALVDKCHGREITAICHRIVHGGSAYSDTCFLDTEVEQAIKKASALAPLHNPASLRWIGAAKRAFPAARQVAAFDTGFYSGMPDVAAHYALPESLDVKRLGFHGLAHRSMLHHVRETDQRSFDTKCVITLQLGSGCSATASRGGHAVDTSMGHTPLEGLVMATRCGDIDPGLVLHLLSEKGRTVEAVETLLSKQSGLLGVSGRSADIRDLLGRNEPRAKLAVDLFCYRVRKYIGAYAAVLGGCDHIVFGGGIGENQPEIRARIMDGLAFLGAELDPDINAHTVGKTATISRTTAPVQVDVCSVEENCLMAEDTVALMALGQQAQKGNDDDILSGT